MRLGCSWQTRLHCSHMTRGGLLEPRGQPPGRWRPGRARWVPPGRPWTPVQAPARTRRRAQQLAQSPLPTVPLPSWQSPQPAEPQAQALSLPLASRAPSPPLQSPQPTEPRPLKNPLPFPRAPPLTCRAPSPTGPQAHTAPRETAGWLPGRRPQEKLGQGQAGLVNGQGPLST